MMLMMMLMSNEHGDNDCDGGVDDDDYSRFFSR